MPNHIHAIITIHGYVGADPCIGPIQNNNIIDNKNHIDTGENMVSPLQKIGLTDVLFGYTLPSLMFDISFQQN